MPMLLDRLRNIVITLLVLISAVFNWVYVYNTLVTDLLPDFTVFWTVAQMLEGRLAEVYDTVAVTEAQTRFVDPAKGARPWVYPPPGLFLVWPFGQLAFWTGYGVWIATGALIYGYSVWRFAPEYPVPVLALSFVAYPVWFAAFSGQTTFVMAAAILMGVHWLPARPVLAGALFALVAMIKPTLVILVPVAVLAGGHYRAILPGLASAIGIGLLSALVFGLESWVHWVDAMQGFPAIIEALNLPQRGVSGSSLLHVAGITGPAGQIARWVLGAIAVGLCWTVFARSSDPAARLVALVGGAFLIVPYAMIYEVSVLIPAAVLFIMRDTATWGGWLRALVSCALFFSVVPIAPIVVLIFVLTVCLRPLIAPVR